MPDALLSQVLERDEYVVRQYDSPSSLGKLIETFAMRSEAVFFAITKERARLPCNLGTTYRVVDRDGNDVPLNYKQALEYETARHAAH